VIDLRQLQALRAVQAAGSVTGAARRLGWSQPTVDYHLKNLERLVGAEVLQRSSRGSSLTPVGALLLDRGEEILGLTDRALRDARDLTQMGRVRLRFGTFPTAAAKLLPSIVSQVNEIGIEIDAVLKEAGPLVAHVNQRELDAVLVYSVPGYDLPFRADVVTTEVLRDPLMLALPEGHPLAIPAPIDVPTLLTLSDERWLFGATRDDPMDEVVIDAFAAAGRASRADRITQGSCCVRSTIRPSRGPCCSRHPPTERGSSPRPRCGSWPRRSGMPSPSWSSRARRSPIRRISPASALRRRGRR
jgi:molybdate transport repressor ModE-like protein